MRLLQINATVNAGSTGRIAEGIGNVMMAQGHESYIAYGRGNRPSASKLIKIGTQRDVYVHGLTTLLLDRHGFGSRKATQALVQRIETIQPDVIGLHNLHGYYVNVEVLFKALERWNIPVVWTLHDCWAFTGHCSHFERVGCEKWKDHCQNCPLTRAYPKSLFDGSYRNFKLKKQYFTGISNLTIVVPSKWLAGLVEQSFLQSIPVRVIYNGVDMQVFKSKGRPIQQKLILGVASVWTSYKGLTDFYSLRSILPNDWDILLIGLSSAQLRDLPEGIRGIAKTSNIDELVEWYQKATIFVNPTYSDNFPTTNIEALACGTPVVTYDTGGSLEAIDEHTGRVVPNGDIAGLASAILELANQDQEALAVACRQRATLLFDQQDRYRDYMELYASLVNQNQTIDSQ